MNPVLCILGGHPVPDEDVHRRFDRSRRNFLAIYLPLADEWGLWDNQAPPAVKIASSDTHTHHQLHAMLDSSKVREEAPGDISEMTRIVLEASRVATEKMLAHYKRMGIKVTPQMTLAPEEKPKQTRRGKP